MRGLWPGKEDFESVGLCVMANFKHQGEPTPLTFIGPHYWVLFFFKGDLWGGGVFLISWASLLEVLVPQEP